MALNNPQFGTDISGAFEAGAGFPPSHLTLLIVGFAFVVLVLWMSWGAIHQLAAYVRGTASPMQVFSFLLLASLVFVLVTFYLAFA